MKVTKHSSPPPPHNKWLTTALRVLAAGKYAALWVPEFLEIYDQICREDGEQKASEWAVEELAHSILPSMTLRVYRVLRLVYLGWKAYRKVARK
ncbi:hypothetical protein SSBR45G_25530 [Bradyrhizobium sp. SSBR45G]|uniref:hypothetical protein n=1 Tax=unclassified Bradyrhizobium TaxID=2631580 RepID=UPI0023429F23|nr:MULTISPECIES: hypothetical protein [unclassified Bradyrhizobium]GLH77645.1 hypothetical protein SSBR45G_25530 [Bradyrhizobium sp. SSBR45G]GLH84882.1 hypothetical protein SSBR45R_23420 [Bradyrhizobium sp. SSBR45R]